MKLKTLLLVMALMLFVGQASAIVDPVPDCISLYFDMSADNQCIVDVAPYTQVPLYLLLTNPSVEFISGFRAQIELEGLGIFLSAFPPNYDILTDDYVEFDTTYPEPEPTSNTTLFATVTVLYMEPSGGQVYFDLGDSESPPEDLPAFQLPDGSWVVGADCLSFGWDAVIGMDCITPTAPTSFDSLKALYR